MVGVDSGLEDPELHMASIGYLEVHCINCPPSIRRGGSVSSTFSAIIKSADFKSLMGSHMVLKSSARSFSKLGTSSVDDACPTIDDAAPGECLLRGLTGGEAADPIIDAIKDP